MSLHTRIFIAMGVGLVAGFALNYLVPPESQFFVNAVWWLDLLGKDLFIGALKVIIAPLILASIVSGITSLPHPSELRFLGGSMVIFYLITSSIAVVIGILLAIVIQPGKSAGSLQVREARAAEIAGLEDSFRAETRTEPEAPEYRAAFLAYIAAAEGDAGAKMGASWDRMAETQERGIAESVRSLVILPILSNPFASLAANPPNALGIIFFAILIGMACLYVGEPAVPIVRAFDAGNEVIMRITMWFMAVSPLPIGCLVASLVATLGWSGVQSLFWYCATVITGILLHYIVLFSIVRFVAGMPMREYLRGFGDALLIAFTTCSSAATLPVTMHCVCEKLKAEKKVAEFIVPIGATVNMDGTALYIASAVIFLIQMFGGLPDAEISLNFGIYFIIFITATLAAIGAAAVPGAGLITMAIVAGAVGLPLYYIPIIFAVDRFLDMFRTSINVMGDGVGSVVVDRLEKRRLARAQR